MPQRAPLGPNQVLVGHVACLGHGGGGHTSWRCRTCDAVVYGPPLNVHCTALDELSEDAGTDLQHPIDPEGAGAPYFSSKTISSIGWVIFMLLPLTSTMESSPVIEWPVDKMKNLSAAWSRNAGKPAIESSPRRR